MFYGTSLGTVYVVDENTKTAYQAQEPWKSYAIVVMPTGIEELETDKRTPTIVGYYDLNGKPINGKQCGAAILRYSDGTTRAGEVTARRQEPPQRLAYLKNRAQLFSDILCPIP